MDLGDLDLGKLLDRAQHMGREANRAQEALLKQMVEASAGGGMVTARVNGALEVVAIRIDPDVVDAKDVEMLQDLVVAACSAAQRKAAELRDREMSKLTGGINIPDMMSKLGGMIPPDPSRE